MSALRFNISFAFALQRFCWDVQVFSPLASQSHFNFCRVHFVRVCCSAERFAACVLYLLPALLYGTLLYPSLP